MLVLLAKAFRRQTLFEWIAQSGRPGIVAPDSGESAPATKLQPEVVPLARAWRWQRLLDNGVYSSVSEIGDTENISKSYVSGSFAWR
jgi:hypothetical protein